MADPLKPGLFLLEDGSTTITRWGAGTRRPATWTTGEFVSGDPAFMKRPSRMYVDCSGQVAISVICDGAEYPVYTTPGGTTRGRPLMLRLPRSAALGSRYAFKFDLAADAELHSVRILGE